MKMSKLFSLALSVSFMAQAAYAGNGPTLLTSNTKGVTAGWIVTSQGENVEFTKCSDVLLQSTCSPDFTISRVRLNEINKRLQDKKNLDTAINVGVVVTTIAVTALFAKQTADTPSAGGMFGSLSKLGPSLKTAATPIIGGIAYLIRFGFTHKDVHAAKKTSQAITVITDNANSPVQLTASWDDLRQSMDELRASAL